MTAEHFGIRASKRLCLQYKRDAVTQMSSSVDSIIMCGEHCDGDGDMSMCDTNYMYMWYKSLQRQIAYSTLPLLDYLECEATIKCHSRFFFFAECIRQWRFMVGIRETQNICIKIYVIEKECQKTMKKKKFDRYLFRTILQVTIYKIRNSNYYYYFYHDICMYMCY